MLRYFNFLFAALIVAGSLQAQGHIAEPTVNLGDTSFLDGIAGPGYLVEEFGDGMHAAHHVDGNGKSIAGSEAVNSVASLAHVAWISHTRVLGAWYGAEILSAAAHVNAGSAGSTGGFGDVTLGPLLLQWPEHRILGVPIWQRVLLDFDIPTGLYSRNAVVNLSSNAFDVHPYYSITALPTKRIEASLRFHYLWNSVNNAPPNVTQANSTQAGQAIHFNVTAAYNPWKGLWVGPNAYYLRQITNGHVNGTSIPNSPERVAAIGPGVLWNQKKWFFYVNAYHEFAVENRTKGNKLVLRVEKIF